MGNGYYIPALLSRSTTTSCSGPDRNPFASSRRVRPGCSTSFDPYAVDMMSVEATVDLRQKPKFFQVLMPGFSHKLDIPIAFHKHIVPEEIATIWSPVGTWLIKIQGTVPNLYFGEGWPPFALAHGLDIGHFLVFCLEGGLNFSVVVLDSTSCGMEFCHPPVDEKLFRKEICRVREEEKKHLECIQNETQCRKKRKKGSAKSAKVFMSIIKEDEVNGEVAKGIIQHNGIMAENVELMGSEVNKRVIKRTKDVIKEKKRNKEKTSESPGAEWRLNSRMGVSEGSGKVNSKKRLCNRGDRILGNHFVDKDSQDHLEVRAKVKKSQRVEEIDASLHGSLKEMDTRREVKRQEDIGVKCCNSKSLTRYCEEHILVSVRRKRRRIKECTTLENDILLEDPEVLVRNKMKTYTSGILRKSKNNFEQKDEEERSKTETKGSMDVLGKSCSYKKVGSNNVNQVNSISKEDSNRNRRNEESTIYVNYGLRNRKVYKESLYSDGATTSEKAPLKYRVTLKPRNLDGHYYIYIPVQFKEHTGIAIREKLLLKDPKGDLWPVDVLHSTKNRTLLMRGWKEFCLSNYLRPGDDCEFQLDPESNENMKVVEVSILKKSKRQRVEALKVRRTCGSDISGTPMFWHTLTSGSQKTNLLQIPNAFTASIGILETRHVMLRYMNGDPFTVNLAHGCRKRVFLSAGWREFCKRNDIKYGDICEFRLESDSGGTPLFRVKKLEKPPNAS